MARTLSTTPHLFRAFADATRLRLLNLLIQRDLCVCELCQVLEEIQPKISRHLAYLRRAGLVTVRREEKWKYYAVVRKATGLERTLLKCVKTCLRDLDALRNDLERLRTMPAGECS